MNPEEMVALDTSIQETVDNDTEFQNSLVELSDEDRTKAIDEKKLTVLKTFAAGSKKNKELADNYKIRAEKAEGKKAPKENTNDNPELPQKDFMALIQNNVHADDQAEVIDYAKLKGISVADALKTSVVKGILAEKVENRKTAEAANTGGARRPQSKLTPDAIIAKANKGEIPEKGSKEAEDLFFARRRRK